MKSRVLSQTIAACIAVVALVTNSAVAQIASSPESVTPLEVGAKVPEVSVRTLEGKHYPLSKVLDGKASLLVFYRGGW